MLEKIQMRTLDMDIMFMGKEFTFKGQCEFTNHGHDFCNTHFDLRQMRIFVRSIQSELDQNFEKMVGELHSPYYQEVKTPQGIEFIYMCPQDLRWKVCPRDSKGMYIVSGLVFVHSTYKKAKDPQINALTCDMKTKEFLIANDFSIHHSGGGCEHLYYKGWIINKYYGESHEDTQDFNNIKLDDLCQWGNVWNDFGEYQYFFNSLQQGVAFVNAYKISGSEFTFDDKGKDFGDIA